MPENVQLKYLKELDRIIESRSFSDKINGVIISIRNDLSQHICNQDNLNLVPGNQQHFYESFLSEYNPDERSGKGVYYTPKPAVSFIIRSVQRILHQDFNLKHDLMSKDITITDPGAGTFNFIDYILNLARPFSESSWRQAQNLFQNLHAFELMPAAYFISYLKMLGFAGSFGSKQINQEIKNQMPVNMHLMSFFELFSNPYADLLNQITVRSPDNPSGKPVIIIGNPPYCGLSKNMDKWITQKIDDYKHVDGKYFNERKHWLHDDYVKFIRASQYLLEKSGKGIIGFITNHSYIDNPTFRGMRNHLTEVFDKMYILNLHGSILKKEKSPDGSIDENIFSIRQGVAISFFIKTGKSSHEKSRIFHNELWGSKSEKLNFLTNNDISTCEWKDVSSQSPYYFFFPEASIGIKSYSRFIKITDIMPIYVTGIITARDRFSTDFSREPLIQRMKNFRDLSVPDDEIQKKYNLKENYKWKINEARKELNSANEKDFDNLIFKILYRPFDTRRIFLHKSIVWRIRKEVMRHMIAGNNLGIITTRRPRTNTRWQHAFVSENIISGSTAITSLDTNYLFPLYLYPDASFYRIKNPALNDKRTANINENITSALKKCYLENELSGKDIFSYIYAVLYSNEYRTRYKHFLHMDFPCIPFIKDKELFYKISDLGIKLIDLHLLKSDMISNSAISFNGNVDSTMSLKKLPVYDREQQRLYISGDNQYINGVYNQLYNYEIGGYSVIPTFLKNRISLMKSKDDINFLLKIITVLHYTIELQNEIDRIYPEIERSILAIRIP